jgi:hypothetical protein
MNGLLRSAPNDTSSWSQLANIPQGTTLYPTAMNLVISSEFSTGYWIASQTDPTTWKAFPSPPQSGPSSQGGGGAFLAYDSAHNILYSANMNAGLFRIVQD